MADPIQEQINKLMNRWIDELPLYIRTNGGAMASITGATVCGLTGFIDGKEAHWSFTGRAVNHDECVDLSDESTQHLVDAIRDVVGIATNVSLGFKGTCYCGYK